MTDLERLIELLKPYMSAEACEHESGSCELGSCRECRARDIADHLLANGVILPPCKIGDTVYHTDFGRIYEVVVENVVCEAPGVSFDEASIGNFIFLTREDAESALERRKEVEKPPI